MKLLYVTWIDSASPSDSSWHKAEELNLEVLTCRTVGWLVAETNTSISLSSSVMENGALYGTITIPKVALITRKVVRQCP